jgi:hypothetical protein
MFACAISGVLGVSEMKTNFIYDDARPFEVRLQNVTGDDIIFARDLMAEAYAVADKSALVQTTGMGHIRFQVDSMSFLVLGHSGQDDWAKIRYPRNQAEAFLKETYALVPFGTEAMDIDALLQDFYDDKI